MNKVSIYPSTFYRVSLKAVIENGKGEVLCVKEMGSDWTLPGGGLDHGETIDQGLLRELREELEFDSGAMFTKDPLGQDIMYLADKQVWQLWVLFRVTFVTMPEFFPGIHADAVAFINPTAFKGSHIPAQQLIYKWLC